MLKIKKILDSKDEIPERRLSKHKVIPKHPMPLIISGSTNSGKTNLVVNMLTNPAMFGGESEPTNKKRNNYFDEIYVISGSCDETIRTLVDDKILEEENIMEPDVENINKIFEKQEMDVESGKKKSELDRVLIIIDDCLHEKKFLRSKELNRLITSGRHYSISTWLLTQYLFHLSTVARANADMIIQFRPNWREVQILCDLFRSVNMPKKSDFIKIVNEAVMPEGEDKFPFLCISKSSPPEKMFRRNFDQYLCLSTST